MPNRLKNAESEFSELQAKRDPLAAARDVLKADQEDAVGRHAEEIKAALEWIERGWPESVPARMG